MLRQEIASLSTGGLTNLLHTALPVAPDTSLTSTSRMTRFVVGPLEPNVAW